MSRVAFFKDISCERVKPCLASLSKRTDTILKVTAVVSAILCVLAAFVLAGHFVPQAVPFFSVIPLAASGSVVAGTFALSVTSLAVLLLRPSRVSGSPQKQKVVEESSFSETSSSSSSEEPIDEKKLEEKRNTISSAPASSGQKQVSFGKRFTRTYSGTDLTEEAIRNSTSPKPEKKTESSSAKKKRKKRHAHKKAKEKEVVADRLRLSTEFTQPPEFEGSDEMLTKAKKTRSSVELQKKREQKTPLKQNPVAQDRRSRSLSVTSPRGSTSTETAAPGLKKRVSMFFRRKTVNFADDETPPQNPTSSQQRKSKRMSSALKKEKASPDSPKSKPAVPEELERAMKSRRAAQESSSSEEEAESGEVTHEAPPQPEKPTPPPKARKTVRMTARFAEDTIPSGPPVAPTPPPLATTSAFRPSEEEADWEKNLQNLQNLVTKKQKNFVPGGVTTRYRAKKAEVNKKGNPLMNMFSNVKDRFSRRVSVVLPPGTEVGDEEWEECGSEEMVKDQFRI